MKQGSPNKVVSKKGAKPRIAIIASRFNPEICDGLLKGAVCALKEAGFGEADYDVPGEFVVSINNPERPDEPADFEFTKQVFQLFKDSEIAVRYGKNPEKG